MVTPDPGDVQRAVGARYEVLHLVGAGGMGAVFQARHRELASLVAIKVLPPEIAASEMRQERFRREAQLAAHLSHPNLVPVYEFETRAGLTYLIMPFVRGGRTLEGLLAERSQLPLADLLRVLSDVGAALDFIHPRGVIHRDVKPANILIEEETGRALLADFGVALVGIGNSLTVPGGIVGTPGYIPPEALTASGRVDARGDLYALAVVAYQALAGASPVGFDCDVLAAELRQRRGDISPALATALVAPLAEQPVDRPPTAAAWLHNIGRATERRWRRPAIVFGTIALLAVAGWIGARQLAKPAASERSLAVMPFAMLGTDTQLPPAQLPIWFLRRLGSVPRLRLISAATVAAQTGGVAPVISEADTIARQLDATYFVLPSLELRGSEAKLSADVYETRTGKRVATGVQVGLFGSLSDLMDAVWAQVLPKVLRSNFAPSSSVTMPHNLTAMLAYANAEEAFRQGDFATALDEYNRVVQADSTFAIAYFRRALVVAQVDPREENFLAAIAGARGHQSGLTPADSLLLEGYWLLLQRGDGRAALQRFRAAAAAAPDEPQTWYAVGEFYYHLGALFDQPLDSAEAAFNTILDISPNFAPAMSNLISFAHMRGDREATKSLIEKYEAFGTTSVVAEVVGIADTLLLHAITARAALLQTLDRHSFTALEYLAFQAEEFGTPAERTGPGRQVMRALERRAKTDSEQVLALRLGVAADLREGWRDSARARLARARTPATQQERDMWLVLLPAVSMDSLGEWRGAADRIDQRLAAWQRGGEIGHWMLSRLGRDRVRHGKALDRLAADSAPLPLSLTLDLAARQALQVGDTARALTLWQQATQRYAVMRVPFDLAASLWWLRLDLARLALARGDTVLAARTCESFAAPNGFVDLAILPQSEPFCEPLKRVALP